MRRVNPAYGNGIFRRRLRLRAGHQQVVVELEDCNHAFRLWLHHDGEKVVSVDAEVKRYPYITCAEAPRALVKLVGAAINGGADGLRPRLPPSDNCTHLHDMALLALAHAAEPDLESVYDISVTDERDSVTEARIDCNGEMMHVWQIREHAVVTPKAHAGKTMMRGFYQWVSQCHAGVLLEAAVALQRGYYVAQGRRHLSDLPASADGMPPGACYSYGHGVVERAQRIQGSVWDLTDKHELLLQFRELP
ncbi:MAG: DUF2889 domain-containing protein [Betaproteobacteria bacterium]|nr:DUF2889 domain-containing protein [Betaproteobacteria bacterium]